MDADARDAISALFGVVPYKLDPREQVPMSRPRFAWTNVEIPQVDPCVSFIQKESQRGPPRRRG